MMRRDAEDGGSTPDPLQTYIDNRVKFGGTSNPEIGVADLETSNWIGYDHYLVQQYILNNKPNEFINSINLVGELGIPNGGRYGLNGSADIADIETNEIWEIKSIVTKNFEESINSNDSQDQLKKYIDNYPGGAIHGKYISEFSFKKNDKTDIVVKSFKKNRGMLYYWERKRKQEQEETSISYETENKSLEISKESLAKIKGLTGAGLVTYIIIS